MPDLTTPEVNMQARFKALLEQARKNGFDTNNPVRVSKILITVVSEEMGNVLQQLPTTTIHDFRDSK